MRVRPLRAEADIRALTLAHGRAWAAAYEGLLPPRVIEQVAVEAPSQERIDAEYERLTGYGEDRVSVVEDDGGSVRGYAVFRWGSDETKASVRPDEAELKELYVDPDYWGRGFGTALLEAGIERLPDEIESVALETLEGNEIGAGFYEARGFEPAGSASVEIGGEEYPTCVYRRPR
jgi:ribosomal protein S18 acetylase RimI-like enzyme